MALGANQVAAIPSSLRELPRWACYRNKPSADGQKPSKVPIDAKTGRTASCTDPTTWSSFEKALAGVETYECDGLMFALNPDDGFVAIDMDNCRNPKNKTNKAWAKRILEKLQSYTEVSPSGTGLHIFLRGTKPGELCRKGDVEIYSQDRFITVTGRRLPKYPDHIEERDKELAEIYREYLEADSPKASTSTVSAVPKEKLEALLKDPLAEQIFSGERPERYHSQSEADIALAGMAVRASWDEGEVASLLREARKNSGASKKHDGYYQLTFRKARGDYQPCSLEEAHETFHKWLLLPSFVSIDVILATTAASHLPGDPLWIHLVSPPSTLKTELIRTVQDWPTVYALTELTPAGLISGRDGDDGVYHSLLPKLNGKTLAIKDLTPTIDLPQEQRARIFAMLRDAFDGSMARHTAMVGTRRHEATFNCVTGVRV